jgi:archaellum component FlaC
MHRVEIARYLARKIEGNQSGTAQNIADTLRALAEQVESLERTLAMVNADCMRLAGERDQLRQQLTESEESRNDRRESPRSLKTH